ncbi:hypothetical protein VC83_01068 [Pseudogymnoascus destructans]|uniref:Protein kinase domain-containing protein n=2 Tax=Pseudogymnoascus destructans TaxID=655981 RepID=L8G3I7_PSED2|nr:uncharacterized protein VC83_01068 [Pseudogymnoascus destructans]ELR07825.1 hypothetical protein GMDG_00446 [Pseudogymnoascus destructans 20631-21]OAF62551.1 hypothetical protein VC83_01068 [Pseudogymnoascus destructans]
MLRSDDSTHLGQRFIPRLLDEFSFDGPNGHHVCLVHTETARSIAAQLIMGVSYLHSRGLCRGDLHTRNFLLCGPDLDCLSHNELYNRYRLDKAPVMRVDGAAVEPHAPPYAVYPMHIKMPAVTISGYGTSFVVAIKLSPKLHTPALYLPPEDFFNDPITQAADIWTLAVNLYEVLLSWKHLAGTEMI